MSVVYLAGPISLGGQLSDADQAAFKETFFSEERRLERLGHTVINPLHCPPCDSWEAYMRHGMRAVANCDVVGVLPRWAESRGASLEVFVATQLRIPVVPIEDIA